MNVDLIGVLFVVVPLIGVLLAAAFGEREQRRLFQGQLKRAEEERDHSNEILHRLAGHKVSPSSLAYFLQHEREIVEYIAGTFPSTQEATDA